MPENPKAVFVGNLDDTTRDGMGKRNSTVCFTEDANRGGVVIRPADPAVDSLGGSLSKLTIAMAFCAKPASERVTFLERIVGGDSAIPGHFRFVAGFRDGDDSDRCGKLVLNMRDNQGGGVTVASENPFIQQSGIWYWVGVVFDHGRVTFYLDGERLGDEKTVPVEVIPGVDGKNYVLRGGYGFTGAFDDLIVIPEKALGDEEMKILYKTGINSQILKKETQAP